MMEPVVIILLYFLGMYALWNGEWMLLGISVVTAFFAAREYTMPFIISLAVMWGAKLLVPEKATWGAVALAIAVLTMMLTGVLSERRKKEEEIPPELLPYLLAMYGGGGR